MPSEREDSIRRLIEVGLAQGDSISDTFLDWLDPQMKHYFRDYYLKGQRLYLVGNANQSLTQQVTANELIGQWHSEFWDSHKARITDKALGP